MQDQLIIDPKGRITLRDVPGIGDDEMGPLVVDRRMKDTLSLHLGDDYAVWEDISARGGLLWESSAFPDETHSLAQVDSSKLGFALGASYAVWQLRPDAAVSFVHQFSRRIEDSALKQMNPTNPEQAVTIANGEYDAHVWIAGFGVVWFLPI